MTFAMQVRHFVRFDLQRTSMWWLVYLALLTITPLSMFGLPLHDVLPQMSKPLLPLLSWCLGMGMALLVVQADAPLSFHAFSKAKPIDRRALAVAKLVVMGLIALTATVSAASALRATGMPIDLMAPTLRRAVPAYLTPIVLVGLFRSVTRSLSATLLLSVGFLVAVMVLVPIAFLASVPSVAVGLWAGVWAPVGGIALLGLMVTLVFVYESGTASKSQYAFLVGRVLVLGFVASVSHVIVVFAGTRESPRTTVERTLLRVTADAPGSMAETVSFDSLPTFSSSGGSFPFTVVGAQSTHRYELQQVRLTPFDGRGIGGGMISLSTSPMAVPPLALDNDSTLTWTSDLPKATSESGDRGFAFGELRGNDNIEAVRTVAIEALLVRYRAERVKVVSFTPGVVFVDSTVNIQLTDSGHGLLELTWTTFGNGPILGDLARGTSPLYRQFAFAVIDSVRRTGRVVGSSSHDSATEWMVLPGAFRTLNTNQLDDQLALRKLMGRDHRSAASLVVYRWVEDGRRRVRQTLSVANWPRP